MSFFSLLKQRSPTFFAPGTGFLEDNFFTDGVGHDGSGNNESDAERWEVEDEASLARQLLTSCCAAQFLTGCGPVPIHGPGVGERRSKESLAFLLYNIYLSVL